MEMSVAFLSTVVGRPARVSLDVQGFTRRLEAGEVRRTDWAEKSQGMARVGIVHASWQEAWYLTGEDDPERAVRALAALGPEEVVVTLGGDGAIICADQTLYPTQPSAREEDRYQSRHEGDRPERHEQS